jgi:acyl-CoA thioesterase-2
MLGTESILRALELEPEGPGRYRARNAESPNPVVFGGQLLAQAIAAASIGHDDKRVKTLHTVFARAARPDHPIEITVDPMQAGRAFASSTVTMSQGDRLCARSLVLLSAEEPDFIRHADPAPAAVATPPAGNGAAQGVADGWQMQFVGDVDINTPELVGPPELDVWVRFAGVPDAPVVDQALLAFASDGYLIATAMRPHEGVGQAQAHVTLSTGVITHTITFHERFSAAKWMLLAHHSVYTGHGRAYGSANVFAADGTLVASYVQDGMIRPLDQSRSGPTL